MQALFALGALTEQQLGPPPEWTGGLQVSRHRKRGSMHTLNKELMQCMYHLH